jgi:hypothetical protein
MVSIVTCTRPSKLVLVVTLPDCLGGASLNLVWDVKYSDWGFSWFSSVSLVKCCKSTSNQVAAGSVHILCITLYTDHPIVQWVQSELLAVSLNER